MMFNYSIGLGNYCSYIGSNIFIGIVFVVDNVMDGILYIFMNFMVDLIVFVYVNVDVGLGNQGYGFGNIQFCNLYDVLQDFDGDGCVDFMDIDSDNDGICDNIEFQILFVYMVF